MVDFNKENTVTTAPADLLKIMILERWNNVIEAFEKYEIDQSKGMQADTYYIKSRLHSLINVLLGGIAREMQDQDIKELRSKVDNGRIAVLKEVYAFLAVYLDKKQLTRIDNRKQYDSSRVEIENREKKL